MSDPRGEVTVEAAGNPARIRLWNFVTSKVELLPNHESGCVREVVSRIAGRRNPPFVHMIGMASRRGPFQLNQDLSQGRVDNVRAFLIRKLRERGIALPDERIPSWVAMGELLSGGNEQANRDADRAVVIEISENAVPTINVRPLRSPLSNARERRSPRPQRLFKIQMLASIRAGIPGAGSLNLRGAVFRIWDTVGLVASDYLYVGAEARVSLGRVDPALPSVGLVTEEGPFNLVPPPSRPMRVHEFAGPARLVRFRVGVPGILGGPNAAESILILTPLLNALRPITINPFRTGRTASAPNLISGGLGTGDLILIVPPSGEFVFPYFGPSPEVARRQGTFDDG